MRGAVHTCSVIILGVAAGLLTGGCRTANVGPAQTIQNTLAVTVPAGLTGGADATWRVTWSGGTPPYTIEMDMGGGATADIAAGTAATSPFEHDFTMVAGDFTYTVTVTGSLGTSGTVSGSYTVASTQDAPSIDDVTYADGVLTVTVSDPDGDTVTVSVTEPAGLAVDALSKEATGGTAVFNWSATDPIAGGSGDTTITADDGQGGTDTATATITIDPLSIPAGGLAAVPLATTATTADTVTVLVTSGDFSNPFLYMNGVGVTVDSGAAYVDTTFNVGAPGGAQLDVDGVWTAASPDSFLVPTDFMIQENDIGGGRVRIDFNVTPINGTETTDGGALFNFELDFLDAGTYTLGFEEFHDVKRTYYSDGASTEYNWDDISNDYPGVPNSIEVT